MPTPPITKAEVERRIAAINEALKAGYRPPGLSGKGPGALAVASLALGVSRGALQPSDIVLWEHQFGIKPDWSLYQAPASAPMPPPASPLKPVEQTRDQKLERDLVVAQDRVRQLEADIRQMHRSEMTTENVREQIFGLSAAPAQPPRWIIEDSRAASGNGVPMVLWSDWHHGEVVSPAQVNGVNRFDMDVSRQRVRHLVERTVDLCFHHMTTPNYPGVIVNLGGDMISGDIHEELSETNELPSMPVVLDLFSVLVWAIAEMQKRFGRVFVACEYGNHGRNTKKPRAKHRAYTNFDWLLYNMLEKNFAAAGADDVRFLIPTSTDAYYSVYGHRYLLTHGDALGTKGGDGIIGALGPILRGDTKVRAASARMGMEYDTLLMGHWHTYMPLAPRLIVNGSLKGFDEYAKDFLRVSPEEPTQALWFSHPRRGITCQWPVKLGPAQPEKSKEWATWAA